MAFKIKIGVLGAASIARRSVIPAILRLPELFELAGVASRNADRRGSCVTAFGVRVFPDYDEFIDIGNLEAIYIPLPNSLHAGYIEKALKRGLHVLIEKPLACRLDEVQMLTGLARERNLALVESFQFRFHAQMSVLKSILSNPGTGSLRHLSAAFGFPPFRDVGNIRYSADLGGGALYDAGSYAIKVSQILLGTGLVVTSARLNVDERFGVDTWGSATLARSDSAVTASVAFGFDNDYRCGVDIWTSEATIRTNRLFTAPADYCAKIEVSRNGVSSYVSIPADDHFSNLLRYFHRCCFDPGARDAEGDLNVDQARILSDIRGCHFEK
jgi:NDP-hexose-3-ketoreductase